ncbi:MAG: TetR/AcrR family transcriptional regulator [Candidatus Bipolaricaulota bacterium]|nr:TetR/AcrR family transcriptional regulator [Candidatus Bipolaricaulota bacterium]
MPAVLEEGFRGPEGAEGGEATRRALLRAAERAFGQAGFHRTTISTITYLAGVGQGTFYLHFPSKVAIFNELVREIGRGFRRRQTLAVAPYRDRRVVEVEGLRSFLHWVRDHPGAYRIVREAEFVDEGVGRWYYTRLAEGYAQGLAAAMERGEIRRLDPEALTYVLLGAAHLSGQRWALWEAGGPADRVLPDLAALVLGGIAAGGPAGP